MWATTRTATGRLSALASLAESGRRVAAVPPAAPPEIG